MLFNSINFIVFFLVVVSIYYSLDHKYRWAFLLAVGYIYYMTYNPLFIFPLLISTVIDYYSAIRIQENPHYKNQWLVLSISVNLSLIAWFKFYPQISQSLEYYYAFTLPKIGFVMPIAITFYTLQTLGYVVDVYRQDQEAERHFGYFALYVSFFPQLLAGPIERARRLLPQLKEKTVFNYQTVLQGGQLIIWGLFQKTVLADRIDLYVSTIYATETAHAGYYWLGMVLFYIQIVCDFAGYSNIAVGVARCLGINISINFTEIFFARNFAQIWRRGHITMMTWLRDYIYRPLGGPQHRYRNIFIVMLVGALWFRLDLTFLMMGVLNGVFIVVGLYARQAIPGEYIIPGTTIKISQALAPFSISLTFIATAFTLIPFRARTVPQTWTIIQQMATNWTAGRSIDLAATAPHALIIVIGFVYLLFMHGLFKNSSRRYFLRDYDWRIRSAITAFNLILIVLFGIIRQVPYIYFHL